MFKISEILKVTGGRLVNFSSPRFARGISINSRTIKNGEAFVAIKGNNFDGHDFIAAAIKKGASLIIKEEKNKKKIKIPIPCIEVNDTRKALGDIARFWRRKFNIPIIAITGSNGKTTAKDMIAWVLSKKFKVLKNEGTKNNQIGLPMTLFDLDASFDVGALELGSNHPGEIEYLTNIANPNIGVITNIGPSHLEYFGTLAGVFREKYTLINNLVHPKIAILNADDDLSRREIIKKVKTPFILGFGIKNQSDFFASDVRQKQNQLIFSVNFDHRFKLSTVGQHNLYNALVAIAIGTVFGLGYEEISSRLATFEFPDARLKIVKQKNASFIDDTYNSNPNSLQQALNVLDKLSTTGRKILVMGDMLELGRQERIFHLQAGKDAAKICDVFITVGELSRMAACAARIYGFDPKNIFTCATSRRARNILFKKVGVKKNDVVLVKGSRAMKMENLFKD